MEASSGGRTQLSQIDGYHVRGQTCENKINITNTQKEKKMFSKETVMPSLRANETLAAYQLEVDIQPGMEANDCPP